MKDGFDSYRSAKHWARDFRRRVSEARAGGGQAARGNQAPRITQLVTNGGRSEPYPSGSGTISSTGATGVKGVSLPLGQAGSGGGGGASETIAGPGGAGGFPGGGGRLRATGVKVANCWTVRPKG
jgi:hypothetical protein